MVLLRLEDVDDAEVLRHAIRDLAQRVSDLGVTCHKCPCEAVRPIICDGGESCDELIARWAVTDAEDRRCLASSGS